jgi:hypothetical protein
MPLGAADLLTESRREVFEGKEPETETEVGPEPEGPAPDNTVTIYGSSDDLIEVDGTVAGCDEYPSEDSHFMLIGDGRQVRVRCWFTKAGLWAIAASQAAEGMDILPVRIEGGTSQHSVKAIVENVRLVIHEQQ